MACTPLVEPSTPELGAHLWTVRAKFTKTLKLRVDVGTRTEVHRPQKVIETVLREIRSPVALEEREILAPVFAQIVADSGDVRLILAIASVFVLHLHHDDRTAVLDCERGELFRHFLLKDIHSLHEVRIAGAQLDVFLLQQPPG